MLDKTLSVCVREDTVMTAKHSSSRKKDPAKGDEVAWRSHGSETRGQVEKKITERTEAVGRTVDASPEEPQYQVRSDKSGRSAVHKPSALKRKK